MVSLAQWGSPESLVSLVCREIRVTQDQPVSWATPDPPVSRAILDPRDQTAVSRVPPAKKVMTVTMETLAPQAQAESEVHQDHRVSRETMERQAHKELKGARGRRDQSVLRALSAPLGQ